MNRTQRILAALLILQVILGMISLRPRRLSGGSGEALLAGMVVDEVVGLGIDGRESGSVELSRVDGTWSLPSAEGYPASEAKVREALAKLAALDTKRLNTRTASSQKRLQVSVDGYVRRIEIKTSTGPTHVLFLGSSPSYGATHVRLDGKEETYLAGSISSWEFGTTATSWVDTTFVSVPEDQISSVTVINSSGQVTLNHDAAGNWTLGDLSRGETLNEEAVRTTVSRASSLTLQSPLGKATKPEYELDKPLAVVKVERKDGDPVTLTIGAQDPADRSYVVRSSSSPFLVRVAEYTAKVFVENARSSYLTPAATPPPKQ